GLHVFQGVAARDELVDAVENVIAGDQADCELAGKADPPGNLEHCLGTCPRVYSAGIGGHLDFAAHDVGENSLHEWHEVSGKSRAWVARSLFLHDGHGDFGKVVHHQIVDRTSFHLPHRCLEPVAPEPLPG